MMASDRVAAAGSPAAEGDHFNWDRRVRLDTVLVRTMTHRTQKDRGGGRLAASLPALCLHLPLSLLAVSAKVHVCTGTDAKGFFI